MAYTPLSELNGQYREPVAWNLDIEEIVDTSEIDLRQDRIDRIARTLSPLLFINSAHRGIPTQHYHVSMKDSDWDANKKNTRNKTKISRKSHPLYRTVHDSEDRSGGHNFIELNIDGISNGIHERHFFLRSMSVTNETKPEYRPDEEMWAMFLDLAVSKAMRGLAHKGYDSSFNPVTHIRSGLAVFQSIGRLAHVPKRGFFKYAEDHE